MQLNFLLRFAKYFGVGVFQFLLDFLLFLFFQKMGVPLTVANVMSRFSAATAGFYLNKRYTFDMAHATGHSMMIRYWLFWACMTAASSLLIYAWNAYFGDQIYVGFGKFLVECLLFVVSFLISKFWVYRDE